ncbi:MAG: diadenylate cyclase CdaA [Bacteroidota bacterium]
MELFHIGFVSVRLLDVLDILIVAFLLYKIYELLKGTSAMSIFLGIVALYILWSLFVKVLDMQLLGALLGQVMSVGVIALIIVFQQEVRRFLILLGTNSLMSKTSLPKKLFQWNFRSANKAELNINAVVRACTTMSKTKTGALIVLGRTTDMKFYQSTGDLMDADVSKRLLESIFFKNSPLHDGAVIIENNKIKAARCVLPVTDNTELPAHYGMRHRAALGITEQSDALAIIVSEETGQMSLAVDGKVFNNLTQEELERMLVKEMA